MDESKIATIGFKGFLVFAGILTWPMMEYFLHRFLGHEWKLKTLFRKEHQAHHAIKDFFAPAYYKAIVAVSVVSLMVALGASRYYSVSFVGMYLFYEWTHYSFHRYAPKTKWGRVMRKHHFYHHYMNAQLNFGVTNTWFDRMGKTMASAETLVKVPKSFAMVWLVDENQKVRPEFQSDFIV